MSLRPRRADGGARRALPDVTAFPRRQSRPMMTNAPIQNAPGAAPPRRRRRPLVRALTVLLVLGLLGVLGLAGVVGLVWSRADTSNLGKLDFANQLKIPPLLQPHVDAAGAKVRINVTNTLPEATTLHWHGMHLPAKADGGPHQLIAPGATWSPTWTIDQPAATLWYHPHPHGQTEDHVSRGLSGLFLLDDPQSRALALPKRYGVDDIPVIIQDKRFRADGGLASAKLGGDILINGTYDPHLRVASQLVRFRLLNASTARTYDVGFADDRAFELIATAFRPGERALLRSFQPDLGENRLTARFDGGDDTFDRVQGRAAGGLGGAAPVPARLARHAPLDPGSATRTRRIEITSSNSIDGKSMDMDRIDQVVTVGTTEVWEVRNGSGSFHNFHVHDVQFEILSYGGAPPPPYLAGPKDTVAIPPGESVRFVARFADYAVPSAPYMFHCHLLRHEDNGLMGQFVVVEPGQAALQSPHHQHG